MALTSMSLSFYDLGKNNMTRSFLRDSFAEADRRLETDQRKCPGVLPSHYASGATRIAVCETIIDLKNVLTNGKAIFEEHETLMRQQIETHTCRHFSKVPRYLVGSKYPSHTIDRTQPTDDLIGHPLNLLAGT